MKSTARWVVGITLLLVALAILSSNEDDKGPASSREGGGSVRGQKGTALAYDVLVPGMSTLIPDIRQDTDGSYIGELSSSGGQWSARMRLVGPKENLKSVMLICITREWGGDADSATRLVALWLAFLVNVKGECEKDLLGWFMSNGKEVRETRKNTVSSLNCERREYTYTGFYSDDRRRVESIEVQGARPGLP
jgi:hypothetical protein